MRYRNVLSRRTLLRGVGGVAIALPFLDEMRATSVYAAPPEPPVRAFNVFFGLGLPTPLQTEGFAGPLEPLEPLAGKLSIVRGIDQIRCDEGGINAHFDGAAGAFTAEPPNGEAQAGGPSLDQILRGHFYPDGLPPGTLGSLLMGTYFRRSRPARYIHCWNPDGSPAALPEERPEDLFARIFGEVMIDEEELTPEEQRARRQRKSVLDSVIEQYKHYSSPASNLGAASRARMADHLERVRELENRIFGEGPACEVPPEPSPSELLHGAEADPDGQGIDITVDELVGEWRIMADLYALAIKCDVARFGGATFQAAGERIRLTGSYTYEGQEIHVFDDQAELGAGGDLGCSHEWWHKFNESQANTQLRAHAHLMQREVAYLLQQLDDVESADENGKTILDNALIVVSTESGDGRHNDVERELSGVFHAVSGAGGRLKTGEVIDVSAEGLDVYNTILQAYGVPTKLGPADRAIVPVNAILA